MFKGLMFRRHNSRYDGSKPQTQQLHMIDDSKAIIDQFLARKISIEIYINNTSWSNEIGMPRQVYLNAQM